MKRPARKLLLFDIDGTLVKTNGAAGKLMVQSIEIEVGSPIQATRDVYLGSTDRLIVKTLLERNGVAVDDVESATDRILSRYAHAVHAALAPAGTVTPLPGVAELLHRCSQRQDLALGLVTGNIQAGARAKLIPPDLDRHFHVGAFGDDALDRDLLPPIAVWRAEAFFASTFEPRNTWIIGDTPKDIGCAQANGLRCLAVASGWIGHQELRGHQPDAVLDDLSDTDAVLRLFDGVRMKPGSQDTSQG